MTVTVADARWLAARAATGSAMADATVWYFGDDHGLYRDLRDRLSDRVVWGDTGAQLNAIMEANETAFINLDRGFEIEDRDWWELTNLAERGPYSTTFTTECCRALLFDRILTMDGDHVVAVEAPDLADTLHRSAVTRNIAVVRADAGGLSRFFARLKARLVPPLRFGRLVFRRAVRLRRLRRLRARYPVPTADIAGADVLFAAWTKPGDFPADRLRDMGHYMGHLPRALRQRGHRVGYIALPLEEFYDLDTINRETAASPDAAILPDDALSLGKLWRLAWKSLGYRARPRADFSVAGTDLTAVAEMVARREHLNWRATVAGAWSEIGPYLASLGCRPRALFHVFENQSWEKGLRQGFRRALPETRIVGCHQSPFSKLYLNMFPARSELDLSRWPDVVLSHGAQGVRALTEAGAPAGRVMNGGLFREGAFVLPKSTAPGAPGRRRVICATGPGYQEDLELVLKAAQAVRARPQIALIINFHPLLVHFRDGMERFLKDRQAMGDNVSFTDQPVFELMKQKVDAVIFGDTNVGFETISSGARAIKVQRDHALSFDKLPDGISLRVSTVDDITRALDSLDNDAHWPGEEEVRAVLDDYFSAIDLQTVERAAGLTTTIGQQTEAPGP